MVMLYTVVCGGKLPFRKYVGVAHAMSPSVAATDAGVLAAGSAVCEVGVAAASVLITQAASKNPVSKAPTVDASFPQARILHRPCDARSLFNPCWRARGYPGTRSGYELEDTIWSYRAWSWAFKY